MAQCRQEDLGQIPPVDPEGGRGLGDTSVMQKFHDRDLLAERKIVTSTLEASTPIMVFKNEACGLRVDNTISIN